MLQVARSFCPGGLDGWVTYVKAPLMVPLELTIEADERMDAEGPVEALTICILNSYMSGAHEVEVRDVPQFQCVKWSEPMIKLIVAVRRNPEMSVEDFQAHWRERHARLVRDNPATARYVRKYVQCHTMLEEYDEGEVAFDGTAELWFDSRADKDAFFSDPDYLRDIRPDEAAFADMERTVFFVTQEALVVDET